MFETHSPPLAIRALIDTRRHELGLSAVELIRLCKYKNVTKGLRRLEHLCEGDFNGTAGLIQTLPDALGVSPEVVKKAVEETQRFLHDSEEAAWRAAFRPHAIIITNRERPEPLFVAFFIGVDRLVRVDFDLTEGPLTFLSQALDGVRERLNQWGGDRLPAFGTPVGVIVNYSPDRAIRFDLTGRPIASFDRAHRLGRASFSIGGREVTEGELATVLSGG